MFHRVRAIEFIATVIPLSTESPPLSPCPFELKRRSSRLQAKATHRIHSPRSLRPDTSRCIFRTVLLTVSYIRIHTYVYGYIYVCFCSPVDIPPKHPRIPIRKQGKTTASMTLDEMTNSTGWINDQFPGNSREPFHVRIHTRFFEVSLKKKKNNSWIHFYFFLLFSTNFKNIGF